MRYLSLSTWSGNIGLTHFLMKHLERSGNQKKKTRFAGLFFLTGLRPVLRLRRPPPPNWIALAHRPTSHSRLDRRCAYPRMAWRTFPSNNDQTIWTIYSSCSGNVGLTHFLMKHPVRSGNQKKKTCFAGLFFLTGLRPVLPLGQCPPSKPYIYIYTL